MKKRIAWLLIATGGLLAASSAFADETRHLNFAAFQKVKKDFTFDPIVVGKFSDFISAMDGAQVLILSHTSDSVDGDVINIQQDVLRQDGQNLGDYGINCQLSFKDESTKANTSYAVGGLCNILRVGNGQNMKLKAIIPPASLPDTTQGVEAWVELYEDDATGIAFYANVSH
ncbi:MAG TPA: hypothetical protein VNI58_05440 [Mariprofundaceae bacterium]|nr:hypothetical protein [Mariprofundaceae bacterium]